MHALPDADDAHVERLHGHVRKLHQLVRRLERIEHCGKAEVEDIVESEDVDAHGKNDTKNGVLATRLQAYAGPNLQAMKRSILDCIGNTSLLPLRRIRPRNGAQIFLKIESENPTGSMKDRMALAMIEAAESDGRLEPGGCVVEYTGGSTGVSLAFVCAVKRYPLHIVTSDAFAREKLDQMRIHGASLRVIASESGGMTEKLTRDMIDAAREITERTGGFWTDQLNNRDQLAAYHTMADEIWAQAAGEIGCFVQSVGTAASLRGIAERLHAHDGRVRIVAVEPAESAVLSGGKPGSHKIDGIGAGFVVPLWRAGLADQIERVSTEDAVNMALRLARDEGVFAGTSTGANVIAALRSAEQLGAGATVVTVMCDTGLKYLKSYGAALERLASRG